MARIIDLTAHSAVYATRLFAETGHDIIRVEPREGDALRWLGPHLGGTPDIEHGAYHQFLNAGKRSMTLDLSSTAGQGVFLDLVRTADVLIANLPLPVDEARITEANPRLVLTEVVDDVPEELCAYARSGLLSITGHPGQRPALMGGHVVYAATGLYVLVATAAALFVAQHTGQGQVVRVSVQESMESLVEQAMVTYDTQGKGTERRGYRGAVTAVSGAFPASDGYWMISVGASSDGWHKLMDWVRDPVLMADPSLEDEAERQVKKDYILDRLGAWTSKFAKEEAVTEAQARHIPSAPVTTPMDLAHDVQLVARGFLAEVDHPEFGRIYSPIGAMANIMGNPPGPAPSIGAHNGEILAELGYSAAAVQALVEDGTV